MYFSVKDCRECGERHGSVVVHKDRKDRWYECPKTKKRVYLTGGAR